MHMRVDPARHDIAACSVQNLVAFQIRPDFDDFAAVYKDVSFVSEVCCDDSAAFDYFGHPTTPCCARLCLFFVQSGGCV